MEAGLPTAALALFHLPLRQIQHIPAFLQHRSLTTELKVSWGHGQVNLSEVANLVKSLLDLPVVPQSPWLATSYPIFLPFLVPVYNLSNLLMTLSDSDKTSPFSTVQPIEGNLESTSCYRSTPSGVSSPPIPEQLI